MTVPEAPLEETEHGLVCTGPGWFVVNAEEVRWRSRPGLGVSANLGGDTLFGQLGIGITVLRPGEPMSMYHWETDQEDFLVLAGSGTLVVEGEERRLRRGDFVHCPPRTAHVIVGGPCVVLGVGAREGMTTGASTSRILRRRGSERRRRRRRSTSRLRTCGSRLASSCGTAAGSTHDEGLVRRDSRRLQVACFEIAAQHLEQGGCFVIEVDVPDLRRLPPGERFVPFSVTPTHVGIDEYDVADQGLISHHYRASSQISVPFRYVWPSELDLMARIAGLTRRERWEDWDRSPFTSESRRHVSVWMKR